MKPIFALFVLAVLLAGCSSAEKKESYTPSPSTIEAEAKDPLQEKIDKRMEQIHSERSGKYRLRSLFNGG
ncbi:MAG: hypothetical protein RBU29_17700 [bacterium]|nr:hypothetical protein [bacterium]